MKSSLRNGLFRASALVASVAMIAGSAAAGVFGSASAPGVRPSAPPPPVAVAPNVSYTNANLASGGVALRSRTSGVIHVSGMTGATQAAWLYVTVLLAPSTTAPKTLTFKIKRLSPTTPAPTSSTVTAKLVTTVGDPCWGSGGAATYRAPLTPAVAIGNGSYQITLPTKGLVFTDNSGADPWAAPPPPFPAAEGASLLLVGTGGGKVDIFDGQEAEFSGVYSYSLTLSGSTGGSIRFESIGADGQSGCSLTACLTGDKVTVNGTQISGPGGLNSNSDWDGTAGLPLPQLWDDTGHVFSISSGTSVLEVSISTPGDCIVPVANAVAY
jgi:hypothetical protein